MNLGQNALKQKDQVKFSSGYELGYELRKAVRLGTEETGKRKTL